MARRQRRPGASPEALLAPGHSWLDAGPSFAAGPLECEVLQDIHRTARLLARRRADVGISQQQAATWAGVTRQTVAAIEDGTSWPDYLTVLKIAAVLGVTVNPEVVPQARTLGPRLTASASRQQ